LSLVTTPRNDLFSNRIPLNGAFAETNGYNIRATRQTGEPNHAFAGGRQSVWWTWTAPASGNASVTTWGSSFDTTLGIYTGGAVNTLTTVANNDDENASHPSHQPCELRRVRRYDVSLRGGRISLHR